MARPTGTGEAAPARRGGLKAAAGFTLIELLVVMAIVALLASIATPRYFDSLARAREAVLRTDLRMLREAIDKARADTNQLPQSLQQLVDQHYIRNVPIDPVTESATTWVLVPHPDGETPGVYDIRSGAPGTARDGTAFSSW
jgi:general secretion pathway protein G